MSNPDEDNQMQSSATFLTDTEQTALSRGRASVACESCKRRKCKCRGGPPCTACVSSNITCVFDETLDRRRKVATKRVLDDLEIYKEVLDALLQVIRSGDEQETLEQIRQYATLSEIAEGLKKKVGASKGAESITILTSPISSTRQDMPSAFADLREPANQRRRMHSSQKILQPAPVSGLLSGRLKEHGVSTNEKGPSYVEKQHDHYRSLVAMLQRGSEEQALEILRTLRSMADGGDIPSIALLRTQPAFEALTNQMNRPILDPGDIANNPEAQRRLWKTLSDVESTAKILPPPNTAQRSGRRRASSGTTAEATPFGPDLGSATHMVEYITSTERRAKRSERMSDDASPS